MILYAIERLRVIYYKELIFDNDISTNCYLIKPYINMIEKDKEIFNNKLDDKQFNLKTYLLIIILTKTFLGENSDLICDFLSKNLPNIKNATNFKNISEVRKGKGKYTVFTKFEKKIISGKDYILSGLEKDLAYHANLPLTFLLIRNESYQKFIEDGGKGFIGKLGLYDSFIQYIKFFIHSNVVKQLFEENKCFKNNAILLENEAFLNEFLDENHFRFLPFYGAENSFGYTNKDLMLSFINSVPELPKNIGIISTDSNIENIYHICLLFSIGVKFITSLHEFIIHLIASYIYFLSNKKISSDSFKEENDEKDGGFFFEKKLTGKERFGFLNINTIITLLDGVSCQKNLSDFQADLKAEINLDNIKKRAETGEFKGFLKDFLEKYPIDFDFFQKKKNTPIISCREQGGIGVFMTRIGSDTYGGGPAIKK